MWSIFKIISNKTNIVEALLSPMNKDRKNVAETRFELILLANGNSTFIRNELYAYMHVQL